MRQWVARLPGWFKGSVLGAAALVSAIKLLSGSLESEIYHNNDQSTTAVIIVAAARPTNVNTAAQEQTWDLMRTNARLDVEQLYPQQANNWNIANLVYANDTQCPRPE